MNMGSCLPLIGRNVSRDKFEKKRFCVCVFFHLVAHLMLLISHVRWRCLHVALRCIPRIHASVPACVLCMSTNKTKMRWHARQ